MSTAVRVITYAEYDTDDPRRWRSPQPEFDLDKFNRELERRGGTIEGRPRFRCVWAGNREEYLIQEYQELTGYVYRQDGKEHFVSCKDVDFEFPDDVVPAPHFETHKVFIPRYAIEELKRGNFLYEKAWTVDFTEEISAEFGKIEVKSVYREPAEIDLERAEKLAFLRDHLTDEQIAAGIKQRAAVSAIRRAQQRQELKQTIEDDAERGFRDGIPGANRSFNWKPKAQGILDLSKTIIREHDKNL